MKQNAMERVREFEKRLDRRPSNCKHCELKTDNGKAEYICKRTEKQIFFGTKAEKCYGDCDLCEKSFPEILEDAIYAMLKSQIKKMKAETINNKAEGDKELFESGYSQCQKDVFEIIDKMRKLRENKI